MIVLDTQVLVWMMVDHQRLGTRSRLMIDEAWADDNVAVSAISFWEIAMLLEKRRLELDRDVSDWRSSLLREGLIELPVDGDVGIRAGEMNTLHGDPADRIIVATALGGHRLLTSDGKILGWSGPLDRWNAEQ